MMISRPLPSFHKVGLTVALIILSILFFSGFIFIRRQTFQAPTVLPRLIDHSRPNFYSSPYEEVVLLSCSSYSYSSIYCYYLPYIALAWRRLGFEPLVFLVGSEKTFRRLPLFNLLKYELKVQYYFVVADRARSVATSQLVRLFGGFLSLRYSTNQDPFVVTADVDLLPITRHRFEISRNVSNFILIVNAFCCPGARFSYENDQEIEYYPISYVGMNHQLWKQIFLPVTKCARSFKFSMEMIECMLKEKFNRTIPKDVVKGTDQWDIDQKLLSLLIARAARTSDAYLDKRPLGARLDPNKRLRSSLFDSILLYDDIHLPNRHEKIIFSNRTWSIFQRALSKLFHPETIQLLSSYHHRTTAIVRSSRAINAYD